MSKLLSDYLRGPTLHLFLSYSRKDVIPRDILLIALKPLEDAGWIKVWYDRHLEPATSWDVEIRREMYRSDVILLLLSENFLASAYCRQIELPHAINLRDKGMATVVPVRLEPIDLKATILESIAEIQLLPRGKPVSEWAAPGKAYENVAFHLHRIVVRQYQAKYEKLKQEFRLDPFQSMKRKLSVRSENKRSAIVLAFAGIIMGLISVRLMYGLNPNGHINGIGSALLSIGTVLAPLVAVEGFYPRARRGLIDHSEGGLVSSLVITMYIAVVAVLAGVLWASALAVPLGFILWLFTWTLKIPLAGWIVFAILAGIFYGIGANKQYQPKYLPGSEDDKWTPEPKDAHKEATLLENRRTLTLNEMDRAGFPGAILYLKLGVGRCLMTALAGLVAGALGGVLAVALSNRLLPDQLSISRGLFIWVIALGITFGWDAFCQARVRYPDTGGDLEELLASRFSSNTAWATRKVIKNVLIHLSIIVVAGWMLLDGRSDLPSVTEPWFLAVLFGITCGLLRVQPLILPTIHMMRDSDYPIDN